MNYNPRATNSDIQRHLTHSGKSRAVVHNKTIYFSGIVSDDLTPNFSMQMRSVLNKIDTSLTQLSSHKSRILSATVFLSDLSYFQEMNTLWNQWIDPLSPPARATVAVQLAKKDYLIEIVVIAAQNS